MRPLAGEVTTSGGVPSGPASEMRADPSLIAMPRSPLFGFGSILVAAWARRRLPSGITTPSACADVARHEKRQNARIFWGTAKTTVPRASAAAREAPQTKYAFWPWLTVALPEGCLSDTIGKVGRFGQSFEYKMAYLSHSFIHPGQSIHPVYMIETGGQLGPNPRVENMKQAS